MTSKGELTRQRIVELAAPLFNQRGFEGCSMHDIMEATGLRKGGLYRHFSSKEELAAEAFRYALAQVTSARTDDRSRAAEKSRADSPVDRLRRIIQLFVETPSPIPGGCPILNAAIDADDGNEHLRGLAMKALREWRRSLERIVEEGVAAAELRPGVNPRAMANTIIATLEGALMISRLERSRAPLNDARAALSQLLENAAAPSARKPAV